MKKYLILTAITTAFLFTACGNTQVVSQETSPSDTSATTLNSATEMTVPAFVTDDTTVTSPPPAETQLSESETTAAQTTESQTTAQPAAEEDSGGFPTYDAKVISNTGTYIAVELLTDSFFGLIGDEAYIMGEFDADIGDTVEISFLSDEVGINESYPPEVHCDNTQVIVFEHAENYDLPYDSGEDVIEHEYSAKVVSVDADSINVMLLDDTFFCKQSEEVRLMGSYDVSVDELILLVISDDAVVIGSSSENFVYQIEAENFKIVTTNSNLTVEAEVTEIYENKNGGYSIVAEAYELPGYDEAVPISLHSDIEFSPGDRIIIEFAENTMFMETSPLQVNRKYILSITRI